MFDCFNPQSASRISTNTGADMGDDEEETYQPSKLSVTVKEYSEKIKAEKQSFGDAISQKWKSWTKKEETPTNMEMNNMDHKKKTEPMVPASDAIPPDSEVPQPSTQTH